MTLAGFAEQLASVRSSAALPSRLAVVLNGQLRWLCQTWTPPTGYPNPGDEARIRGAGSAALALAIAVQVQVYDSGLSGVPSYITPRDRATGLVRGLAAAHRATAAGGWGGSWQSALWAWLAGAAGWLQWRYLSPADRESVLRMVEFEADAMLAWQPHYLRDLTGNVLTPGDSGMEECAWNALAPALGSTMMPGHPHAAAWRARAGLLCVQAMSHPDDCNSDRLAGGVPVAGLLGGSNLEQDYTVTNHGISPHPDYMAAAHLLTWCSATFNLAGRDAPEACCWNLDRLYPAMSAPAYGGRAIYTPGEPSPVIYYPTAGDWGNRRPTNLAALDVGAWVYGCDTWSERPAGYWADVHLADADAMQQRHPDGHLVEDNTEDSYVAREQWNAAQVAMCALLLWLRAHGRIRTADLPLTA